MNSGNFCWLLVGHVAVMFFYKVHRAQFQTTFSRVTIDVLCCALACCDRFFSSQLRLWGFEQFCPSNGSGFSFRRAINCFVCFCLELQNILLTAIAVFCWKSQKNDCNVGGEQSSDTLQVLGSWTGRFEFFSKSYIPKRSFSRVFATSLMSSISTRINRQQDSAGRLPRGPHVAKYSMFSNQLRAGHHENQSATTWVFRQSNSLTKICWEYDDNCPCFLQVSHRFSLLARTFCPLLRLVFLFRWRVLFHKCLTKQEIKQLMSFAHLWGEIKGKQRSGRQNNLPTLSAIVHPPHLYRTRLSFCIQRWHLWGWKYGGS